ncbi:MAG: DUF2341 domain-containing protein, partial [Candidatus Bathyarchaeota archaeon]
MITRNISLKTILLLFIVLMPLILSGLSLSQPVSTSDPGFKEHTASKANSVLVAGGFKYFDVEVTVEVEKICIIAYHGDSLPEPKDRFVGNYYRWEYDHGIWKDVSGHDSVYIKPSQCVKNDNTYSFYIGVDNKVKTGHWTVKILIDDDEVEYSSNSLVVVAQFNFFLTALMGVYAPINSDKKSIVDIDFICSNRKRVMIESKENIDKLVDEVLSKHVASDQEEDTEEIHDLCFLENKPSIEDELVKSTVSTYHKSKLKIEQTNAVNSLFFNKKCGGGNGFRLNKSGGYRRFLAITLAIILLSAVFVPIITPQDTTSSFYPIISSFDIFPAKVNLNDSIWLNVSISDSDGITSVVAYIGGQETINLSFVEGTIVNDTIYSGFWQSTWLVKDVDPGEYTVEIVALDRENRSASQQRVFTILQTIEVVNIPINNTLESEFNESLNITQTEQQNNTIPNNNDTFQDEAINNTVLQNTTEDNVDNEDHSEFSVSNENEGISATIEFNNILYVNQTSNNTSSKSTVFIVDKRHEDISVLPGTRFYVERTIDGPHGTNIIFVPMFSDALTLESIEVVENTVENMEKNASSNHNVNSYIFDKGEARFQKEQKIEQLRENLPPEIKALNKIAYTDSVELQSPRTLRLWFRAPTWEELQNGVNPSSGEISYLVFSEGDNNSFDFEGSTWWNSNWNYRKLINVNSSQVEDDLINFPILVSVTDVDLASKAQDDGDDIAFVLDSDGTKLNHEIESFNGTTGELIAWVNVTSLSSAVDTLIWMYYNNSDCSSQENIPGTWDSNYVAVWHFNDDSLEDSTSYGYDGVNSGTSYNSGCKIAGGREYTGDDWININNFHTISTSLTAETWMYRDPSDSQNFIRFFTEGPDWNDNDWCLYWRIGPESLRFVINNNDYSTGGSFPFSGEWFHTAVTYDTGDAYLYKNGALEFDWSGEYGPSINNVYDTLTIGNQNGGGRGWIGRMDEVRISDVRRSTAWIGTTYNTTSFPDTFLSFDTEQNVTNTSVNPISPYNITYSPLTTTATGASGLDNVTLWYRFSTDNSSWDNWIEDGIDTSSPWEWS